MKKVAAVWLLLFLCAAHAFAQDASALMHPAWNYGIFAGYGNGVSQNTDFHRFTFGGRVGRVLTGEHGPAALRGTFEWGAEFTPIEIFNYHDTTYAGGVAPMVLKWNFTSGKRNVVPFFEVIGGALLSAENFPKGDTSRVNFQTGAGIGVRAFPRAKRAVTLNVRALHISNASLGNHNPGIDAHLQFQVGYTWFK